MNNRHFIILVSIVFAFLLATPGFANQTNAMNSEITIVAGGSGYSDTLQIPDSQEPTIHYSRYKKDTLNLRRMAIYAMIIAEPDISIPQIAKRLDITDKQARSDMDNLKKNGYISHEGPAKGGKWIVCKE